MSFSQPTLLMTRPLTASQRFVEALDSDLIACCDVIYSPLVKIEYLRKSLRFDGIAGVIFTSLHGVHAARLVADQSVYPAYCVGPATTRGAADAGWQARQVGEDAVSLTDNLIAEKPNGPLLHIRGDHARGDIAQTLTKHGLPCDEIVMYTQTAQPFSNEAIAAMEKGGVIIAPVFSPRTARLFRQGALDRPFHIVAMSHAIAEELDGIADWTVLTAPKPDAEEMRALVEKLLHSYVPG